MKRIFWFILLLFLATMGNATDLRLITITDELAADSSDSAKKVDTTYSDTILAPANDLSWGWELFNIDTNFSVDTVIIEVQTAWKSRVSSWSDASPVWLAATAAATSKDSLAHPGTNDTTRYAKKIIPEDSMLIWVRFRVQRILDVTGAQAQSLAGNSYTQDLRIWWKEVD